MIIVRRVEVARVEDIARMERKRAQRVRLCCCLKTETAFGLYVHASGHRLLLSYITLWR